MTKSFVQPDCGCLAASRVQAVRSYKSVTTRASYYTTYVHRQARTLKHLLYRGSGTSGVRKSDECLRLKSVSSHDQNPVSYVMVMKVWDGHEPR